MRAQAKEVDRFLSVDLIEKVELMEFAEKAEDHQDLREKNMFYITHGSLSFLN